MTEEKKADDIRSAAITVAVLVLVIVPLVAALGGLIVYYEERREAVKLAREHRCALACVPDAVSACPSEGKPVCATDEPWPSHYAAGNRPPTYWERERECEAKCQRKEKELAASR